MEIESKNGSKIRLEEDIDFGRGLGFDRTVSRRHVSFKPHEDGSSVSFQVKGKNPIWVRHSTNPHIRVYSTSQSGQLNIGDSFCVSSKHPVWFNLKKIASEDESNRYEEAFAGLDHDEIETGDVSDIDDPVKEFGFVVMGHEFDCYQKELIRDMRNWNWFLEEPNKDSDEDDEKRSRKKRKKKKKSGRREDDDDDDEVWTGESEEDVESIKKLRNDMKPKYSTRSKDKGRKGAGASKSVKDDAKRKATSDEDEYDGEDDEDEGDETLGGFIVDDEDIGEGDEDDDDEEEFEEDEDDE